jgi:hypothetical protein
MSRSIILLPNWINRSNDEKKIHSGYSVASCVFQDIEYCFIKSKRFKFGKEYNSKIREHAAYSGSGKTAKIKFSKDFCEYEKKL